MPVPNFTQPKDYAISAVFFGTPFAKVRRAEKRTAAVTLGRNAPLGGKSDSKTCAVKLELCLPLLCYKRLTVAFVRDQSMQSSLIVSR